MHDYVTENNKRIIFLLMIFVILGCILRVNKLGEKSLWIDELVVISNAANIVDIKSFFSHTRNDDLPKFYSLLFKYWVLLGTSESTMRMLSVIFGCLQILTIYALSRLYYDTKTSLCAALLTATSPFLILYDREIRMYSLFALLSSLSTYYFIRSLRERRIVLWFGYAIMNILNTYTHYYALLVIAVQWLFIIIRFRDYKIILKPWLAANAFIILAFSIRMTALIQDVAFFAPWAMQRERFPFIYGKHFVDIFYIIFSFSVGQTILPWNLVAIVTYISVIVCFILALRKGITIALDNLYLLLLLIVPVVIGIIFRIAMPRYFIFLAPIYYILVAKGMFIAPRKIVAVIIVVVTFGWGYGIANYYNDKQFHMMAHVDPWRDVAMFLKNNITEGEEIVGIGLGVTSLRYYYDNTLSDYSENKLIDKVSELAKSNKKRIWLIYTHQEEYENYLKSCKLLDNDYNIIVDMKWSPDPDYEIKKIFFRKTFVPYRIVARLYERKY